jgi:hypothetical protein
LRRDCAGVAGLIALRQALCVGLQKAGLGKWPAKGCTAHLMLLYDAQKLDERIEPVEWTVRSCIALSWARRNTRRAGRWVLGG